METLLHYINLDIPHTLFNKNPRTSETGKKILRVSAQLIAQQGIDVFTFRKLSASTGISEATIYRYFDSKNQLLLFFLNKYWGWQDYRITTKISNLKEYDEIVRIILEVLTTPMIPNLDDHVYEKNIVKIAINESVKVHLNMDLAGGIEKGNFIFYTRLLEKISAVVKSHCPEYPYPNSLVATVLDTITQQLFYEMHFPSLMETDFDPKKISNFVYSFFPKSTI